MVKKIILAVFISIFVIAGIAQAVELCLSIDSSGSISSSDFDLQKEGIAQAIEDPTVVPQDGTVTVSVVQFGSVASVEVSPTVIDSQATADSVAATVRAITKGGGGTCMSCAIDTCRTSGFNFAGGQTQTIDISTDGQPNSQSATITARDNAVAAGVDVLNALGVGTGIDQNFLESLVWPQPSSTPPNPGFVVVVNNFSEYVQAVKDKIQAEVGPVGPAAQVPTMTEWGMIIFMLLAGLGSIYYLRRRKRRA